jgi:hypothetical protein
MNVLDILKKMDYNVVAFNSAVGIYEVRFNSKKIERMKKILENDVENKDKEKPNIYDTFYLKVKEVKFNELGNLYVSFSEEKLKLDMIDYYDSEENIY